MHDEYFRFLLFFAYVVVSLTFVLGHLAADDDVVVVASVVVVVGPFFAI